jgi:propanediol utilization protein
MPKKTLVRVEVSAHHTHLSREDADKLFGKGYPFKIKKDLSQPGQYAAEETVTVMNGERSIDMRVLGPERKETQVEVSMTDAMHLRLDVPVRESGHLEGTPGVTMKGPKGTVTLARGVMIAQRHFHCSDKEAKKFKLKDQEIISIRIPGDREVTFGNVVVRVNPKFSASVHLDTDEGNAAGIKGEMKGELIKLLLKKRK